MNKTRTDRERHKGNAKNPKDTKES